MDEKENDIKYYEYLYFCNMLHYFIQEHTKNYFDKKIPGIL